MTNRDLYPSHPFLLVAIVLGICAVGSAAGALLMPQHKDKPADMAADGARP